MMFYSKSGVLCQDKQLPYIEIVSMNKILKIKNMGPNKKCIKIKYWDRKWNELNLFFFINFLNKFILTDL